MKRLCAILIAVGIAGNVFAARAEIRPVSNDPYTSAIVVDAATGEVLFEENADVPVYPASVIKLMGFLLVLEQVESGKAKFTDTVNVTAKAAKMGGSQVYLKESESFTLDEMLYAFSIKSANDVAVALGIHFAGTTDNFVKLMNRRAAELGMTNTTFASVHGLPPDAGQQPDVSTARDIARLSLEVVKHPEALRYTSTREKWFRNNTFQMLTHNRLLHDVEGCDGLKTGYFKAGGFSISATAKRKGRRVIAVVMGCNSRVTRDAKARELLAHGFLNLPEVKEEPEPKPVVVQPQPPVPQKPKGPSFWARVGSFFRFLGKCLLFLLLIAAALAGIGGVLYLIKRHRERWKYRF